nr:hypothetical protein GCM10020093_024590 [Planobispora longispora]
MGPEYSPPENVGAAEAGAVEPDPIFVPPPQAASAAVRPVAPDSVRKERRERGLVMSYSWGRSGQYSTKLEGG